MQVIRIVLEHGIDLGWIEQNPAKGVKLLKSQGEKREPWPDEKIADFREAFPTGTRERLLLELCLGTGQRIADVLKMTWFDVSPEGVKVVQNKTGKKLQIPCTPLLKAELDCTPKRGETILTNTHATGPWSYRAASQAVLKVRQSIGAKRWDIHSLRHNDATELKQAGCTPEEIEAVTGMSPATQRIYTAQAVQLDLARKAQEKRSKE